MKIIFFIQAFTVCFLLSIAIAPATAAERAKAYAKAMFVKGSVQVVRQNVKEPASLARGDSLSLGDRVTVGNNSKAVLVTTGRKIINLTADSELKIGDGQGKAIQGLGLGMFASGKGRRNISAQATTRADESIPLLLSPRNSVVRSGPIVLNFHPLKKDERYEIETVGVSPPLHFQIESTIPKLALTKERIGHELTSGKAYYLTIRHYDSAGALLQEEKDIRVGLLEPAQKSVIDRIEKELQTLMKDEKDNPAYPTLLAETYEANYLFQGAIRLYDRIYRETVPGDPYSLERLKHLYAVTCNNSALRTLEKTQPPSSKPR